MISIEQHGDFRKTELFLNNVLEKFDMGILDKYGKQGVAALAEATPRDTGRAANSWYYEVEKNEGQITITWSNSDIEGGYNVALLIQYGHGTRNGGYVRGVDYINPAMKPIFDNMVNDFFRRVE